MKEQKISFWVAILPVIVLITTLSYAIVVLGADPHIPLLTSAMFAAVLAMSVYKIKWADLEEGITSTIKMSTGAIIILMIIGMVIGTWILSGIVPVMIYYGLKIIAPEIFLFTTLIMCSIISLATGSSWTTAGTIGVALIGIGETLGIPTPIIGGAIISGAYFGDKMSPLSDTTNLAAAMAEANLFDHIKHMVYTTVPTYIISSILYLIIGFNYKGSLDLGMLESMNTALESNFNLNPLLLLIPIVVIGMVLFKVPAIPGLFAGAILGGIAALVFQGSSLGDVVTSLHYGYTSETGIAYVDELLTRGGLDSMMWTISLILSAMIFAGVMETSGMLGVLASSILKLAKSTGSLVTATILTSTGINILAGDQYLSIVIPGRMYKQAYDEKGLHEKNLSRTLEDGGTLTSPLIPWNTCGATMINTLGLTPWTYVPYAFFNIINPFIAILFAYLGYSIVKKDKVKVTS